MIPAHTLAKLPTTPREQHAEQSSLPHQKHATATPQAVAIPDTVLRAIRSDHQRICHTRAALQGLAQDMRDNEHQTRHCFNRHRLRAQHDQLAQQIQKTHKLLVTAEQTLQQRLQPYARSLMPASATTPKGQDSAAAYHVQERLISEQIMQAASSSQAAPDNRTGQVTAPDTRGRTHNTHRQARQKTSHAQRHERSPADDVTDRMMQAAAVNAATSMLLF